MESTVSTIHRRPAASARAAVSAPLGLGASAAATPALASPRPNAASGGAAAARDRNLALRRRRSLARGAALVPAALPLFDLSAAVLQSLDDMRTAVGEDMVLASTLHVPAHHVLACRAEVYGTPFSAPALQDLHEASSLTDDDKQFAACLAAPPDLDEGVHLSFTFGERMARMASMAQLQSAPSLVAQASGTALSRAAGSISGGDARLTLVDRSNSVSREAPARTRSVTGTDGAGDGDGGAAGCGEGLAGAVCTLTGAAAAAAAAARRAVQQHVQQAQGQQQEQEQDEEAKGGDVLTPLRMFAAKTQQQQQQQQQQSEQEPLLVCCTKPVEALVGLGALLLSGFSARCDPARSLMERRVRALLGVRDLVVPSSIPASPCSGAWGLPSDLRRRSSIVFQRADPPAALQRLASPPRQERA